MRAFWAALADSAARAALAAQAAPSFACLVGGALVDTWSGGNSARLHAAIRRFGSEGGGADAR